jgi:ABC-type lipopolysaccharide export system ATPase subunit
MLTVSQVAKSYSGRTLFSGASLQVNRGERIGLSGRMAREDDSVFPHPRRELAG